MAAETRLSGVDGEAGELTIAGFPVEELAGRATFEEVVYLLWNDELPDAGRLEGFREELAGRRGLPRATMDCCGPWRRRRCRSWMRCAWLPAL